MNAVRAMANAKPHSPRDSRLLCDYAIRNLHKLRIEHERDFDILCLRELVETEDELIGNRTRLQNRIMAQIAQICPGLADLVGSKLDTKAYSEYLLRFDPRTPASDVNVKKHLKTHHVNGTKTVETFLEKHRAIKVLPLGAKLVAVHLEKLRSLIRPLQLIQLKMCSCKCKIEAFFNILSNAEI